ncbi:MAG: hypothetical protein HWE39_24685 [Oceanospirillaceae bacterium]|nr:hypothetical protein [Oceanospirillaceae bacterium]
MKSNDELHTVYELFDLNNQVFPFYIRGDKSYQTCLKVIGWSKYLEAKSYQGVPSFKLASVIREVPESFSTKSEDFFESGTFVGIRVYADKETPVSIDQSIISVTGASTRSWEFA